MTKLQIRMRQVDQVKEFVDLLSKYPYEMDLVSGRYTIDAKSLLGIYSLDLSNPLTLVIYSDSCEELLTQLHARWHDSSIRLILENEKYMGDALLQKTYTVDFLKKKRIKNNGLPVL